MNNPYKNLTQSELVLADHYADTGNMVGLRQMQTLSNSRNTQSVIIVRGSVENTSQMSNDE